MVRLKYTIRKPTVVQFPAKRKRRGEFNPKTDVICRICNKPIHNNAYARHMLLMHGNDVRKRVKRKVMQESVAFSAALDVEANDVEPAGLPTATQRENSQELREVNEVVEPLVKKQRQKAKAAAIPVASKDISKCMPPQWKLDLVAAEEPSLHPSTQHLWLLLRQYPEASIEELVESVGEIHEWDVVMKRSARVRMTAMEMARQQTLQELQRQAPLVGDLSTADALRFTKRTLELIQAEPKRSLNAFDV